MPGPIALIGGEGFTPEFTPALHKLATIAGGDQTRVVVLPTAAAEDGDGVPQQRAKLALDFFGNLGIQATAAMVIDQQSANDPTMVAMIASATWIHLAGGQPDVLKKILVDSAIWQAILDEHQAGKLLVGSSAGAVILGQYAFSPRRPMPASISDAQFDPLDGFNLLPGIAVGPHFDGVPPELITRFEAMLPPDATLLGIDEKTALLGQQDTWQVIGAGGVTLLSHDTRKQYPSGAVVPLFE